MIVEATKGDIKGLLELYTYLHDNPMPELNEHVLGVWEDILKDPHHHIVVYKENGMIVSSVVYVQIPNLTHGQRPYGVIENVITHPDYRKRGYAGACLDFARNLAKRAGCYKLMLMTGSKLDSTLNFYEQAGYNRTDKTAFIQWFE